MCIDRGRLPAHIQCDDKEIFYLVLGSKYNQKLNARSWRSHARRKRATKLKGKTRNESWLPNCGLEILTFCWCCTVLQPRHTVAFPTDLQVVIYLPKEQHSTQKDEDIEIWTSLDTKSVGRHSDFHTNVRPKCMQRKIMLYEHKSKDNIPEMERWGNNATNITRRYTKTLRINGSTKFWMFINAESWVDTFGYRIFTRFSDPRKHPHASAVHKKQHKAIWKD